MLDSFYTARRIPDTIQERVPDQLKQRDGRERLLSGVNL